MHFARTAFDRRVPFRVSIRNCANTLLTLLGASSRGALTTIHRSPLQICTMHGPRRFVVGMEGRDGRLPESRPSSFPPGWVKLRIDPLIPALRVLRKKVGHARGCPSAMTFVHARGRVRLYTEGADYRNWVFIKPLRRVLSLRTQRENVHSCR